MAMVLLAAVMKVASDAGAPESLLHGTSWCAVGLGALTLFRRKTNRRFLDFPRLLLLLAVVFFLPDVYARVGGDGAEYYVQARSLLFDLDVDYANDYEGLGRAPVMSVRDTITSRPPVGVSLFWLPGLLLTHCIILFINTHGAGLASDGFSIAYTSTATLTSYLLGWAGVFLIESMVRRRAGPAVGFWVAFALALATPLAFYMTANASMSHAVSAFAGALFVWSWSEMKPSSSMTRWTCFGLVAGLVVLVRVQDGTLVLLALWPLLAGGSMRAAVRFSLGLAAAGLLQASLWFAQHGSAFIEVMAEHSMVAQQRPDLVEFLLSPWHGLVSWTPVYGLALIGLFVSCKREPRRGIPLALVFFAAVYLNASIGDWWASESFGQRRMLGLTAVFGLGLGEAILWFRRSPLVPVGAMLGFLTVWNLQFAAIYNGELAGARDEAIPLDRLVPAQVDIFYRRLLRTGSWMPEGVWVRAYDSVKGVWLFHGSKSFNGRVDLGREPVGYYPLVGEGWFDPEEEEGRRFRSSRSRRSWLSVPLHDVDTIRVVVFLRRGFREMPARVRLDVNGEPVSDGVVTEDWSELHFEVPENYWRRGINQITLVYSTTPRQAIPNFRGRNSAVQVDWVEFRR